METEILGTFIIWLRTFKNMLFKVLAQTEWYTWNYTSADFYCDLDALWTGCMTYTVPTFQKNTCMITLCTVWNMIKNECK